MAAPINSTRVGQTLADLGTIASFSIVTTALAADGSSPPGHRHRGDRSKVMRPGFARLPVR
jgi:hypothetical protein